jgi:uncharacterized protein (TIGR00369 family)
MTALDAKIVALVERVIVSSPYASLLGVKLVSCEEDHVVLRLPFRREIVTVGDTVHGGAIGSLIDVAATAAFWASASIPAGARGTTVGLTVNFLSAARGIDILATARVRRRGREISSGEVTVRDAEGKEIALALVTYKLSGSREPEAV